MAFWTGFGVFQHTFGFHENWARKLSVRMPLLQQFTLLRNEKKHVDMFQICRSVKANASTLEPTYLW